MTDLRFEVDMVRNPWGRGHAYTPYAGMDHVNVLHGLNLMMKNVITDNFTLVPLTLTPDGIQYYVCITRVERNFRLTQVRLQFDPNNNGEMFIRERPIRTSGVALHNEFNHLTFDSGQIYITAFGVVFWDVLQEYWTGRYNHISLSTNKHTPTGLIFKSDSRADGWVHYPAAVPLADAEIYNPMSQRRIEISIREICSQPAAATALMFMVHMPDELDGVYHYVAIIRNGDTLKVVDAVFNNMTQNNLCVEKVFIFPGDMNAVFPGFRFGSSKLTDAEKEAMVQKPVYDRYKAAYDAHFRLCRALKRWALLSCLHPSVARRPINERPAISILGRDILTVMAKTILTIL